MKFFFSVLFCLITIQLLAQTANSPYTNNGLGEQMTEGMIPNNAMGGVGLANPSYMYTNSINPALLSYNRVAAFNLGVGTVYNNLRGNGITQNHFNGNLQYIALAFPISKKYTASVGLQPFTGVNYNYSSIKMIENSSDLVRYTQKGDGGLTSVYLSQGFKLNKAFSIGLKATYLFGAVDSYSSSAIVYSDEYTVEKNLSSNYHGLVFKPGIAYQIEIKKGYKLNFGVTYQLPSSFNSSQTLISQRTGVENSVAYSDTIYSKTIGNIHYPSAFGLGVGLEKSKYWSVGLDFNTQHWSSFKNDQRNLKNSYSIGIGGELLPDFSSERFFGRLGFQAGINYSKTRLVYNGRQLNDLSFSIGSAVPVSGLSLMNVSLSAGSRGTSGEGLYKENYVKFSIGVSLNDRNWFVRKKYD